MNTQTLERLTKFNKWTRSIFPGRRPPFSSRPHVENDSSVTINRGKMRLVVGESATTLSDISMGVVLIVYHGPAQLEEVLMMGLTWAIRQEFHATYQN